MTESKPTPSGLSDDDKCKLHEINGVLKRTGVSETPQETMFRLMAKTGEVTFSAAVQEGHRQMVSDGIIAKTRCRRLVTHPRAEGRA